MAYEHHCMKLIDISECERMYGCIPLEMKLVVTELNNFIMNGSESTIYDHDKDTRPGFKMDVIWVFRDGNLGSDPHQNWVIASNFEDGMPAWVLNEDKRWYVRIPMSEHDDILKLRYDWINIVHELKCMLTGGSYAK